MASVASQLIEAVTAHTQNDSLEDAREICAEGTYFLNNLRTKHMQHVPTSFFFNKLEHWFFFCVCLCACTFLAHPPPPVSGPLWHKEDTVSDMFCLLCCVKGSFFYYCGMFSVMFPIPEHQPSIVLFQH